MGLIHVTGVSCGYDGSLMVAAIMDTVGDTMGLMELVLIVDICMMEDGGDVRVGVSCGYVGDIVLHGGGYQEQLL